MATVIRFNFPDTTKITALMAVIQRTKLYAKPANKDGAISGSSTLLNVVRLPVPKSVEASSTRAKWQKMQTKPEEDSILID